MCMRQREREREREKERKRGKENSAPDNLEFIGQNKVYTHKTNSKITCQSLQR